MAYMFHVVARDRDGEILGEKDVQLPHTPEEAITLGYAANLDDFMLKFNAKIVVEIQAGIRTKTTDRKKGKMADAFRNARVN